MNTIQALHTSARRYCIDRAAELYRQYMSEDWLGSQEEIRQSLLQRCRLLNAMLVEIETIVPADFSALEDPQEILRFIGQLPESNDLDQNRRLFPQRMLNEERALYREYLQHLTGTPNWISSIVPLPYRRTLREPESKALGTRLADRWQYREDLYYTHGFWYPAERIAAAPRSFAIFHADAFIIEVAPETLQGILAERGVQRVFELLEFPDAFEHEVALSLLEPRSSKNSELCYTSASMDWLIYISEENTILVAGEWLVESIKAQWADWSLYLWKPE